MNTKELLIHLYSHVDRLNNAGYIAAAADIAKARDTIERLEAELAEANSKLHAADKTMEGAAVGLEQLLPGIDALKADAARYRWLRGDGAMGFGHPRWACWQVQTWGGNPLHWQNVAGEALDVAIDEARHANQARNSR